MINTSFPLLLHLLFIACILAIYICARPWYAFFTPMKKAYHGREEGVPHPCALPQHSSLEKGRYALCTKDTCSLRKEHETFAAHNNATMTDNVGKIDLHTYTPSAHIN